MSLFARLLSPRFIRFGVVGFSGVFINLGAFWLFADLLHVDGLIQAATAVEFSKIVGVEDVISSATAIEISIVWNFLLNNAWTFQDRNENAKTGFLARMLRYNLVSLVGLGIQVGTFIIVSKVLIGKLGLETLGNWKYAAQTAGIAIAIAWNFLSNFYWTWAQTSPSSNQEQQ